MNWAFYLPHLLEGDNKAKTCLTVHHKLHELTVELADLPGSYSMSRLLSTTINGNELVEESSTRLIIQGGKHLDSAHLILLALNEECRGTGRGAFYHLPLREVEHQGHPCDLVYLPNLWDHRDKTKWDQASWMERLVMRATVGRIEDHEDVVPICTRILQFGIHLSDALDPLACRPSENIAYSSKTRSLVSPPTKSSLDKNGVYDSRPNSLPTMTNLNRHSGTCNVSKVREGPLLVPSSQRDPAIKPNELQYSRPIEDISTYIILYPSHFACPTVCPTAAIEHRSLCDRSPTPNDMSETFEICPRLNEGRYEYTSQNKTQDQIALLAAGHIINSGLSSNREVVELFWEVWHEQSASQDDIERQWLGRIKWPWQEIKTLIEGGWCRDQGLPSGWPMST